MPTYNQSASNNLFIIQNPEGDQTQYLDAYGTLCEANEYFDNRLRSVPWRKATKKDKMSALREATKIIDRLNFAGQKTNAQQYHQFPREPTPAPTQITVTNQGQVVTLQSLQNSPDASVPEDIKFACFEIAIKLVQGYDPDKEADLIATQSISWEGVKTAFDRSFVPDYLRAGIPSFRAWSYIKPYLVDPNTVTLSRV